jgi:CRP/FNR family cyclic AMP-dependent transcriptional regulator
MVKIEDLKRINMLKAVPDHLLGIIGKEAQLSIFGTNTQLFSIGERVDTYYMLIMGQVALKIGLRPDIDVILENLQSGGSFGSSALISGSKASYTAVCQEPCEVITLYGPRMIEVFETNHELAYHMMTGVGRQYKKNMDTRAQMIIQTLNSRPELKQEIDDIETLTPAY